MNDKPDEPSHDERKPQQKGQGHKDEADLIVCESEDSKHSSQLGEEGAERSVCSSCSSLTKTPRISL